ncbi:uncharacterized protein [Amphiura filiformis]|uniref:uncharacterized protein n=1 Tax=Amphiura filiformis TaxID=82378 RepID=UPI003B21EED5
MAPEIHVGNERGRAIYSKPADIWAYGMLLLEICTRKPPFPDLEWHRVVFEVGNGAKPSIPEGCPKDLTDIMQQCWKKDPRQRPPIASIVKALSDYVSCTTEIYPKHQATRLVPKCIACCPNGDLVMSNWEKLYLLDGTGKCKLPLRPTEKDFFRSICVSPLGYIFTVCDFSPFVHVFSVEGDYLSCFNTLAPNEGSKTDFNLACLAGDREGNVLVGCTCQEQGAITIHTCPDGRLVNKIRYSVGSSASMVVNSKNQILIHSRPYGYVHSKLVAIDYLGKEVFSFTPKIDEDTRGVDRKIWPCGIACDDEDNIYVAMKISGKAETGHIHAYSPTGAFLQCIAKGLYHPYDLSMAPDGSLMVANGKSILIYRLK